MIWVRHTKDSEDTNFEHCWENLSSCLDINSTIISNRCTTSSSSDITMSRKYSDVLPVCWSLPYQHCEFPDMPKNLTFLQNGNSRTEEKRINQLLWELHEIKVWMSALQKWQKSIQKKKKTPLKIRIIINTQNINI